MATLVDTYLPLTNKLFDEGQGLSAVQVGNKKYAVRDANSRAAIAAALSAIDTLSSAVQGGVHYIGKTTSELSDGATTNPIIIGGESVTVKQGDMVSMEKSGSQDLEFIFNGTTWYELGSTGTLKSLAFKDSASGDFAATLTAFSGTAQTAGALTVDFTGATFSGDTNTICAEFTGSGITPSGTFSGEQATLTAPVATKNTELTVPFSGVSVNVITSISTDAIKAPPALSVSTV